MNEADHELGPVLEIWEGYASDPDVRYRGSSGGILSALALYCLERENMAGVLHTGMDETRPWTNKTVLSRNRTEVLATTGSRYAPASPCEGLGAISESERPCVFIGKPCDVAGVALVRKDRPELDRKIGLVLTFFCAGTPSTRGTLDLVKSLDVRLDDINEVRYRGEGWPGRFRVRYHSGTQDKSCSYFESWDRLANYRPLRCHLCPDGLGHAADLSCGDAWQNVSEGDPGRSIVLVRTERGRMMLHRAMTSGYVELRRIGAEQVLAAQPSLLQRRRELFGRLVALKLLCIPTPVFTGFSLLHSWMRLRSVHMLRIVLGTVRRIVRRSWWRRNHCTAVTC